MVAVKAHEADRFLAAPPENLRLFLVYGSDQGAITERARHLERLGLSRGGGDSVTRLASDEIAADPGRIADEAYSASLFGGEPVLALRVIDGRHNVIGALQPLLDRPPEAAWLIVAAADLAASSPLRKAFERSSAAVAVPAYPLEGRGLAAFITAAAEEAGITVEPPALERLMESLSGDRLAGRGELEKLFLYVGDAKSVTVEAVEAIVGETTGARTDAVIDAALAGNSETLEAAGFVPRAAAQARSAHSLCVTSSCFRRCAPASMRALPYRRSSERQGRRSSSAAARMWKPRSPGGLWTASSTRVTASTAPSRSPAPSRRSKRPPFRKRCTPSPFTRAA